MIAVVDWTQSTRPRALLRMKSPWAGDTNRLVVIGHYNAVKGYYRAARKQVCAKILAL